MPPETLTRNTSIKEMRLDVSKSDVRTGVVDLGGYGLIGLIIEPLETTDGNVILYPRVSASGIQGTYVPIYDSAGNQFTIAVSPGIALAISADYLAPLSAYRWVQFELSMAQAADKLFTFVLKG